MNYSAQAHTFLAGIERGFPSAGIIVATRTHHTRPPLPGRRTYQLLPISRSQRTEYLKQALEEAAAELEARIESDPALYDLTPSWRRTV